jgi:hypothetical protein
VAVVVHRAVAAVAQPTEEGGRNPRKVSGLEKEDETGRTSIRYRVEYTYAHHTIRGILHLGLVKFHLLLMQHCLDLRVLPSDDLK